MVSVNSNMSQLVAGGSQRFGGFALVIGGFFGSLTLVTRLRLGKNDSQLICSEQYAILSISALE